MRPVLTILLLSFSLVIAGQKYSTAVPDTAIFSFMSWLLKSDTAFKATRQADNDMLKLQPVNFEFADSLKLSNYLYAQNIFNKRNNLGSFFNQSDATFFIRQIENQQKRKWNLKIKGVKFVDTIEMVNNRVEKVLYSYSMPLFTKDNKYVVIIEAFFCGLVCGGGDYNLYERQSGNTWKLVKQFNHWDE